MKNEPQNIPQNIPQITQEHSSNESAYQRGYLDGMAKRPQPLTDEQIKKIFEQLPMSFNSDFLLARAIEAAHGIKGAA